MNAPNPQVPAETAQSITPMDLMHRAIATGADPVVMEKFMGLHERWEANKARKAFDAAMADAKSEIKTVSKNRQVDFTTNKGRTKYAYEDFATVAEAINPALSKHGLSFRFRTAYTPGLLTVTCIISHRDGHSEENTLSASPDASGNKNDIQAIGSAVTYLQRYTLKAALGVAASEDDDGQSSGARKNATETEDEFAQRWKRLIDTATDDVELDTQWDAEAQLRSTITWRRKDPNVIEEAVNKRIKELIAKQQPDLITQRLRAEET